MLASEGVLAKWSAQKNLFLLHNFWLWTLLVYAFVTPWIKTVHACLLWLLFRNRLCGICTQRVKSILYDDMSLDIYLSIWIYKSINPDESEGKTPSISRSLPSLFTLTMHWEFFFYWKFLTKQFLYDVMDNLLVVNILCYITFNIF